MNAFRTPGEVEPMSLSPEEELAALKKERASKEAARIEVRKVAAVQAEIAAERERMKNDETFDKLLTKHGPRIGRLNTLDGEMVVVRAAEPLAHRRFMDEYMRTDSPNKHARESFHDAAERLFEKCAIYPEKSDLDDLLEKWPSLADSGAGLIIKLGAAREAEDEGK